jgi:hypothetical protein
MATRDPAVFIGSSSEGKEFAEELQSALDDNCEATVWDQGVFGLSTSGLQALVDESSRVDFAVLVLTPDDLTMKRGREEVSARDNVIFEAGLFIGALGPQRTILVHPKDAGLNLPTDLAGITTCQFRNDREDGNIRAAINPAAREIRKVMDALGLRSSTGLVRATEIASSTSTLSLKEEAAELERELDALSIAAEAQGWSVKTRSRSAFRLLDRGGSRYSFPLGDPRETRIRLREFAQTLAQEGLRINQTLLLAPGTSAGAATAADDAPVAAARPTSRPSGSRKRSKESG